MTNQELKISATYIKKLASFPDAEDRISLYLDSLFATQPQKDTFNEPENSKSKAVSSLLHFTYKEIKNMATTFKKVFIANGLCAHVLKKPSGKNSYCYEIRYRSNGYDIRAYSTDLTKAKELFIAKTTAQEIEKYRIKDKKTTGNLFCHIFEQLHQYKYGTLCEKEHNRFRTNFYNLPEELRNKPINAITTLDLDKVMKEVKPRKYEELRTLFNGIFKYAMASGILTHNPVALIKFKRSERQTRGALSEEEIKAFLGRVKAAKYDSIRQFAYVLYFFGLRPCEIDEEAHREGEFLIARNRKRKNGKIEYKKIPIPTQAQGLIDWNKPLTTNLHRLKVNDTMKELLDGKTAYYLRHTFATTCQQYVRPDIVDIWMGDSPTRLVGRVYTHFPDKFMREQMNLVVFPTI